MTGNDDESEREHSSEPRYRALLELAAMDKTDFEGALRRILEVDAQSLGVRRVNCWAFEKEPQGIRCIAAHEEDVGAAAAAGVLIEARSYPHYFQALAHDPIILAHDAANDARTRELADYMAPHGITSMMDVPIWVRGGLWGVVCHEHVGPRRRWSEADRDFAVSIGHIVSMAVEARDRADAERAVEASEFFVGILSHDLRNPLTSIKTSAEYLIKRSRDETSARAARRILRGSERMTRMVEQLLDFTRIRLGSGLPVRPVTTDLDPLCRRVTVDARAARPDRAIHVEVVGDVVGRWDPDRVWQMLSNLIVNAAEHATEGTEVRVALDGRAADDVSVVISNAGSMPPDLLPVLFDPFHRSRGRSGGLGLGLFIAREIAVAHGGDIRVDARATETVVTVTLPRAHPEHAGEESPPVA
jgi:signal transduction histidine kinase